MKLERAREWREARGLTQRELADRAGVSPITVPRVERGDSVRPPTARKLAEALGVEVVDLMERPPALAGKGEAPQEEAGRPETPSADIGKARREIEVAPVKTVPGGPSRPENLEVYAHDMIYRLFEFVAAERTALEDRFSDAQPDPDLPPSSAKGTEGELFELCRLFLVELQVMGATGFLPALSRYAREKVRTPAGEGREAVEAAEKRVREVHEALERIKRATEETEERVPNG